MPLINTNSPLCHCEQAFAKACARSNPVARKFADEIAASPPHFTQRRRFAMTNAGLSAHPLAFQQLIQSILKRTRPRYLAGVNKKYFIGILNSIQSVGDNDTGSG